MSIDLRADAGNGAPLIPGAYERNTLTYRQPGSMGASASVAVPMGSSSLDAATIAEREREGGGSPSQRRRKVQVQGGSRQVFGDAARSDSWLTGGYRWLQVLRLARR